MKIDMLTLFPEIHQGYVNTSIFKRAVAKEILEVNIIDIRDFATDKHHRVDDRPTGGGAGLIMKPEVACAAIRSVKRANSIVIMPSPRGQVFNQEMANKLKDAEHLVFIAGHYEGIDERVNKEIDMMISLGDFILTGGELPSLIIVDAVIRLIAGVIDHDALLEESFSDGLLEYPQYTLPRDFEGDLIPEILFSGNHQLIREYRLKESLRITYKNRPDLLKKRQLNKVEMRLLAEIMAEEEKKS